MERRKTRRVRMKGAETVNSNEMSEKIKRLTKSEGLHLQVKEECGNMDK